VRKINPYLAHPLHPPLVWSGSAQAQSPFADVKPPTGPYHAGPQVAATGIIKGYPNGDFQGQRTLTRYEFAGALQRALASIPPPNAGTPGPQGDQGDKGHPGEKGEQGIMEFRASRMTPDESPSL